MRRKFEPEFAEGAEREPVERNVQSIPTSYPCARVLLSRPEEIRLCNLAQQGDEDARRQMMEANLKLVMSIARRYRGRSMEYQDLVQEGIIGLLEAVKKFDGSKGFKFSTYATWWVRQAIVRAIEKHDRMIRLPVHGCNAARKIEQAEKKLDLHLGHPPTVAELAAETGLASRMVQALLFLGPEPFSLDVLCGEDEDVSLVGILPDPEAIDPEDNSLRQAMNVELRGSFAVLTEKERFVIERRFGFRDGGNWTLSEIAQELKMSREGVRHVESRAIKKLRGNLASSSLFPYAPDDPTS